METISRSQLIGLDAFEVAAALGYDRSDIRGVSVEPTEVLVVVLDSDGEILQQTHPIVEG